MKKHFALAAGLAALLSSGAAMGADINGSLKDGADVFSAPKEVNWTGFYIQGHGGYGNANHNLSVQDYFKDYCASKGEDAETVGFDEDGDLDRNAFKTVENKKKLYSKNGFTIAGDTCETLTKTKTGGTSGHDSGEFEAGSHVTVPGDSREIGSIDGVNSHGGIGGGRIGFDVARGKLLFGVFGDYNFTNMQTDVSIAGVGNFGLEKDDEWSVGGRIGYIVAPRTLVYVLAAYTQTEYNVTGLGAIDFGDASVKSGATFDGISVGGGIEFALTNNVFLGMEYAHTFYGEEDILNVYSASANQGLKITDDLDEDKILGTLKIKLNGSLFD